MECVGPRHVNFLASRRSVLRKPPTRRRVIYKAMRTRKGSHVPSFFLSFISADNNSERASNNTISFSFSVFFFFLFLPSLMDSTPSSRSNDCATAQKFCSVLPPPPSTDSSSLSTVDDPAEKSSPVLPPPPPSPSMDSDSFSIDSTEKFTIDLLSSLIAKKASSSVLPPPPPPSSSMDSSERLITRKTKRRNGETVDEIINQWKESKSNNLSVRGGGDGFKRRTKNLGKRAKRGYMKGKGGPDNLGCEYKGVRQRTFGKWVAEIREPGGGRLVWLGTFNSARDAALAFDKAALAMYGSYAKLNIPEALNSPSEAVNSPPEDLSSGEMFYVDTELRLGIA